MSWWKKLDDNFEEYLVMFLMLVMIITAFAQVIFRFVIQMSLDWSEELARYAFLWCMFISAGMAVKHRRHIKVEFIMEMLPKKVRLGFEIISDLIWMAFCLLLVKDGIGLLEFVKTQVSPSMEVPFKYIYTSLPVGAALMFLRLLQQMVRRFRGGVNGV
jgi:TRAP-type C4-dicarboxylate transport system permease small subunit